MIGPGTALFTVLLGIPMVMTVYLSFTNWRSLGNGLQFVGFANYRRVFNDPGTLRALAVTAVLATVCTVAVNVIAVTLAVMMNRPGRIYSLYRAAVFYPFVVSPIISGFLWAAILSPDGAAQTVLHAVGLGSAPFLTSGNWAVASLALVTIWNIVGFSVVLYLAGLQTIPTEMVEAGTMDGVGPWQRFRYITWPLLSGMVTINLVLVLVGLLATYDLVLSLTAGGPAGESQTIAYEILAVGYAQGELGYASAGAVLLLVATTILAVVIILYRSRREVEWG